MMICIATAQQQGIEFILLSLQDCRSKGVRDKLSIGQTDTQSATGHTSSRMIQHVYDRRVLKMAKPVE